MKKGITFKVLDIDETDELLKIEIHLNNGLSASTLEFYCYDEQLNEFGIGLSKFPKSITDMVTYEGGEKGDKWAFYLFICALCDKQTGRSTIKIETSNNGIDNPYFHSEFEIKAEPASINRLGQSLRYWNPLEIKELEWNPE